MFTPPVIGKNQVMKNLMFANSPSMDSGNIMTETSRQSLSSQLARVIATNLICLALFILFCTAMTFGSPSLLLSYWNEHRAASVVVFMVSIVSIPGIVELAFSRWGLWQA
jgi:hypothetical protein